MVHDAAAPCKPLVQEEFQDDSKVCNLSPKSGSTEQIMTNFLQQLFSLFAFSFQ